VIGATADPMGISPLQLLLRGRVLRGHPSGTAESVQETMEFSVLHGIVPTNEVVPLSQINDAFQRMMSGAARFRMVLTPQ
jgi:alcohol dehydrogenase